MTHDYEPSSTPTVLLVDDDDQIRTVLWAVISRLGYETEVVASGSEALRCMAERDYDAVLCDLLMPNMTGDELFRACRQERPEVASRFVFITGCSEGNPCLDFATSSGQPLLRKPCRLGEIGAALERVIQPVFAA
jgi:two-component system, cell cycle sensor histidine kinase and response regulator CckA